MASQSPLTSTFLHCPILSNRFIRFSHLLSLFVRVCCKRIWLLLLLLKGNEASSHRYVSSVNPQCARKGRKFEVLKIYRTKTHWGRSVWDYFDCSLFPACLSFSFCLSASFAQHYCVWVKWRIKVLSAYMNTYIFDESLLMFVNLNIQYVNNNDTHNVGFLWYADKINIS